VDSIEERANHDRIGSKQILELLGPRDAKNRLHSVAWPRCHCMMAPAWRYRILGGLVAAVLLAIFFWLINQ